MIRRLLEELSSVLDAFGWYGIGGEGVTDSAKTVDTSNGTPEPSAELPAPDKAEEEVKAEEHEDEEDDDDYDDYDVGGSYYDPWDIQSAVDEALSNLIKAGVILEPKDAKDTPSLESVFETLFGGESELTKQAAYFEELISGYEDQVSKDDLAEAYDVLETIMKDLGWKQKPE